MTKRWQRWLLGVSAAALVLGTPGMASADSPSGKATFAAQPVKPHGFTAALQMTKDEPVPTRAFTGPYMLADPSNPRIIVAATSELRTRICYLMRSTDAGRTWHILPASPSLGAYPFCTNSNGGITQTPMAWGRNDTLYFALGGYNNQDGGDSRGANNSMLLARSTNLGNSWSTTIVDNTRGDTGPAITHDAPTSVAVDTSGPNDVVYVGFNQSHPKAMPPSPDAISAAMVSASTDGGQSFAKPVNLNQFSHVTVAVNGTDYPLVMGSPFVAASRSGVVEVISGPSTTSRSEIPGATPPQPLIAGRSTDQGKTWTLDAISAPAYAIRGPAIVWSPKGGPSGTFLAAYQASPGQAEGESDIEFQRSTDGGQTWSPAARINDDHSSLQLTHYLPRLDVAPNGRVDAVWWDFRLQHGFSPDVFYTYSSDDGATWAHNIRVTDHSVNLSIGISANSDVRQPPGVASANQYAAFGWADSRLGNPDTQTQDVFGDVTQFAPLPATGSTVAPILAAVFGGLAVAGLILLAVILSRRRKEGPPPPRVDRREPVGVE